MVSANGLDYQIKIWTLYYPCMAFIRSRYFKAGYSRGNLLNKVSSSISCMILWFVCYMAVFNRKIKSFRCVVDFFFSMWYLTVVSERIHEFWCSFDWFLMHTYSVVNLEIKAEIFLHVLCLYFGGMQSVFDWLKVIKSCL